MNDSLPLGKLPVDLLAQLLAGAPIKDSRVLYGPGIGLDCAVIDLGERVLVFKSDPITLRPTISACSAAGQRQRRGDHRSCRADAGDPPAGKRFDPAGVEAIFDQIYRAARR